MAHRRQEDLITLFWGVMLPSSGPCKDLREKKKKKSLPVQINSQCLHRVWASVSEMQLIQSQAPERAGLLWSQAFCSVSLSPGCSMSLMPPVCRDPRACIIFCVRPWTTHSLWALWKSPGLALLPKQIGIKKTLFSKSSKDSPTPIS